MLEISYYIYKKIDLKEFLKNGLTLTYTLSNIRFIKINIKTKSF